MSFVVWMFAISALMQVQPESPEQAYRAFAAAMPGDPARGKAIFQQETIACASCHSIGEGSLRAGPDLLGIGDKYPRAELIRAVLEPSAFILTGYATTTFVTESGKVHSGIIARRDVDEIELLLANNQQVRLASDAIVEEQRNAVSLMPSGVDQLLTPQEFTDLISYLVTLKQPVSKAVSGHAVPENIARLMRPVQFETFHSEEIRFQRPVWFDAVPGTTNCFVVAQHNPPEIWILEKRESGEEKTLFLSLHDEAVAGEDTGILGMVFHPNFLANRKYYVYHHVRDKGSQGAVIVERFASENYRCDAGVPSRRLVHIKRWTVAHTGGVDGFRSGWLSLCWRWRRWATGGP